MLKQKQVKFLSHASLTDLTSSGLNTPEFSYITGENAFYTKIGGVNTLIGGGKFWGLNGNAGTTPGTDFIGTTDNVDIVFKRNNNQIGYLGGNKLVWGLNSFNIPATTGTALYQGSGTGNFAFNTNGSENYIGAGTLNFNKNTTGSYNMIGAGSANFFSNTSGSNNYVGAGIGNFFSNTFGGSNTVGAGSYNFFHNVTGNSNTVGAGYRNFRANINGSNNTALGHTITINEDTVIDNVSFGNFTVTANGSGVNISGSQIESAITQSGGSIGTYVFIASIQGINEYPASIVNSNTIFRPNTAVGDVSGRNLTLTIPQKIDNSVAIGAIVGVTKSNQVTLGGANTTEVKFRGETGYNYCHDVSNILSTGDDGKVWTYEHSSASIKMKSISGLTVYGSYDDDTDAAANGVPIDGVYEYSSTNTEGMPEGVLKRRKN